MLDSCKIAVVLVVVVNKIRRLWHGSDVTVTVTVFAIIIQIIVIPYQ